MTTPGADDVMQAYAARQGARIGEGFLSGISSARELEDRRPELRRQFLDMLALGPYLPAAQLHATLTGIEERGDAGFRIEKLHYQSIPGLYVTACLYVPDGRGPFPAMGVSP